MFRKECGEVSFCLFEVGWGEAPEVHGNDVLFVDFAFVVIEAGAGDGAAVFAGNINDFFYVGEELFCIQGADATIDSTVFGEGVDKIISYDGVVGGRGVEGVEEIGGNLIGVGAIKIVGVDDGEGFLNDVAGGAYGVSSAPRFFAFSRDFKPFR